MAQHLFFSIFGCLLTHEMDAIRLREWKIFPILCPPGCAGLQCLHRAACSALRAAHCGAAQPWSQRVNHQHSLDIFCMVHRAGSSTTIATTTSAPARGRSSWAQGLAGAIDLLASRWRAQPMQPPATDVAMSRAHIGRLRESGSGVSDNRAHAARYVSCRTIVRVSRRGRPRSGEQVCRAPHGRTSAPRRRSSAACSLLRGRSAAPAAARQAATAPTPEARTSLNGLCHQRQCPDGERARARRNFWTTRDDNALLPERFG